MRHSTSSFQTLTWLLLGITKSEKHFLMLNFLWLKDSYKRLITSCSRLRQLWTGIVKVCLINSLFLQTLTPGVVRVNVGVLCRNTCLWWYYLWSLGMKFCSVTIPIKAMEWYCYMVLSVWQHFTNWNFELLWIVVDCCEMSKWAHRRPQCYDFYELPT